MDTQILQDIGLTNAEIKVYLALLELGTATAGPILDKSGLQNSVVHMTLHKLIEKGFITYIKEGKRNHYQATNPKHISDFIENKKTRFEKILPQLLLKQQQSKEKPEVISFRGIKGIKQLFYELLEAGGKHHHTLNSPKEALMMGDHFWIRYHKKRAELGIKAKQIFNESLRDWVKINKYKSAEVRFTKKGFEPLTETIVRNYKVGIIIWSDKPLGMIIHQQEAAQSYEKYFQLHWQQAKQ